MPDAQKDVVRFAVHQRKEDPTEIVAYIIKDDDFPDHDEYMTENGYTLCENIQGETFKAITGEAFYIRITGDLKMNTFGDHSYHHDRFQLMYLRNRTNRKDFFIKGVYRGRFQPEYVGKVLLQRLTVHAGTVNRGSGRSVALNNLESVLGKTVSTSAITLTKDKEDPAPPEVQDEYTDEELMKDVVLRTISKDIPKEFVIPLAMHLFGLTETEVLNLSLLPHQRDFDEQRYYLLEKWKQSQEKEEGATFSQLINAFKAVKMTAAASTLNRNLLTDKRLRQVAKGLPGDLKPLADVLGVNEEEVNTRYTDELNEFKFQILWRWREDSHEKLTKRACHSRLLKAMRSCGMEISAEQVSAITSVAARDVVLLRIITKDAGRKKIVNLVHKLGLKQDDIDQITKDHGQDFNKRLFLLNALIQWREKKGASFEYLMEIMDSNGMIKNADVLDEELVCDKRLREAAALIDHDMMQTLADELKVDTAPMMIPYNGNFVAELGYRLMSRWKESRGKYASHTEMMKALEDAGLEALGKDVDTLGSVDTSKGGMSDFCLRYVSSWCHVSRAHEWPSVVQNIPTDLVTGLDERTIKQIKRELRDPSEQMAKSLILCRDRGIMGNAGALVNRLVACGFEKAALTLLDVSRSQYYCTTLRLDEVE